MPKVSGSKNKYGMRWIKSELSKNESSKSIEKLFMVDKEYRKYPQDEFKTFKLRFKSSHLKIIKTLIHHNLPLLERICEQTIGKVFKNQTAHISAHSLDDKFLIIAVWNEDSKPASP